MKHHALPRMLPATAIVMFGSIALAGEPAVVYESAREIPVAYRVDVLVVGGTTGAVSAAVSAAEAGATVFLAAPRPYLGDDMVATLRLWDDDRGSDLPLVRKLFEDPTPGTDARQVDAIPITYQADRPSNPRHADSADSPKLTDGQWGNASADSIQYDGDVSLLIDAAVCQPVRRIRLMAHHREDSTPNVNYMIGKVEVSASDDRRSWRPVAEAMPGRQERSYVLSIPVDFEARYVKLSLKRSTQAARLLLSEVQLLGPEAGPVADAQASMLRPMHVKKVLDDALLQSGVTFLYGCFPTDVVRDVEGNPCGIVMANRSGRQAVLARWIIDATDWAVVARMAGAELRPASSQARTFRRVVIGGRLPDDSRIEHRTVGTITQSGGAAGGGYSVVEYTLRLDVDRPTPGAMAEAEQQARDATYQPGQVRASEKLFCVPWTSIVSLADDSERGSALTRLLPPEGGTTNERLLNAFRAAGAERIFVLSGCADISRDDARRLLDPPVLMKVGAILGRAAAQEAAALPAASGKGPCLPAADAGETTSGATGDIREVLDGVRPAGLSLPPAAVPSERRLVPVLGSYDVVVIGGGTSGAPAAIAAARQGASVLVVEYQEGLGGIGTLGLIGRPHRGKDIGFTREVPFPVNDPEDGIEHKMEWYRREIRKAGGRIWLGTLGCGAFVDGNRVRGAVVATPEGQGVVLAKVVVDATGNADVAAAAGAPTMYGDEQGGIALQGSGLPQRPLGAEYVNTDYLLVEEDDTVDVWAALVGTRRAMPDAAYDAGTMIQNRERRRIVGDHVLRYLDQVIGRTYPDTIVLSESNYDSHGYPSGPFFALLPQDEKSRTASHSAIGGWCYTPYRCLLPKGLDGILVVGLGMSMERDASAMVRMQRDLQNQGYAAGVAAAMAANEDLSTRQIDVRALQEHLVAIGNLPEEVLHQVDNFPLPAAEVAAAITAVVDPDREKAAKALAVVLANRQTALPLVGQAMAGASGAERVAYAKILGFWGRRDAVPTLITALEAVSEWDAMILQGVAAEYAHLPTPVDALVLALGTTGDRRGVPAIAKKLELLDADTPLSHHRAVALALERIGDQSAAEPLARLLAKPGMRDHAMTQLEPLFIDRDKRRREGSLREIVLARALYRCGDYGGLGKTILEEYRHDLRGLFARHAATVLSAAGSASHNGRL